MRGTLLIYSPAGVTAQEVGELPKLELLKAAIGGGYLEVVPHWTSIELDGKRRRCVAFCDEDGKHKGLPLNPLATTEWDAVMRHDHGCGCAPDYLVGNVVVVFGDREFMEAL
jgi:hypothetical protein